MRREEQSAVWRVFARCSARMLSIMVSDILPLGSVMPFELAPMPTGTVTFLLTDVEGSTCAWETDPDPGAVVLRHYELLDAAAASHGGFRPVDQGEGDSFVAAFAAVLLTPSPQR